MVAPPPQMQQPLPADDFTAPLDTLMFTRSPAGCTAYIVGSLFFAITLNSRDAMAGKDFALLTLLLISSLARLRFSFLGRRHIAHGQNYKRVKVAHKIAVICMGISWTLWISLIQFNYGSLSPESFIGMLFSLSLAAGAINSLASQRDLLMTQHIIIVGGVGLSTVQNDSTNLGPVFGSLILIFLCFMLLQSAVQYKTLKDNITLRLLAEKETSKTISILNATPGYLALLDSQGKSIHIGPSLRTLLNLRQDQSVTPSFGPLLHELISSFLKQPQPTLTREMTPGGPFGDRNYMVTLFKTEAHIHGVAIHMLDITQQKNNEMQLDEMRQQAEHASRLAAVGEMVGSVAHEIRNPLTIIDGRANYLKFSAGKGNITPEMITTEMESISKMVHRINKIIVGVLKFSHRQVSHTFEPCSLNQLLDEIVSLVASKLKTNDVEFRGLDKVPKISLECRPIQISQVLVNLIGNAIDAIENCANKWIEIRVIDHAEKIVLKLTDSGPGIPPSLREQIMQPFFTTKGIGKGTGLGLSISRGIIAAHKGTLSIDETAPNTTFVIELWKVIPNAEPNSESPQVA